MDTRWKKWTALKPVKAVCFVLILVLSFVIATRFVAIVERFDETGVQIDVVLSEQTSEQHFFDLNMGNAFFNATVVLLYGSEERILAGEHMHWDGDGQTSFLMSGRGDTFGWFELPLSILNEIREAPEGTVEFREDDIWVTQNDLIMQEQQLIRQQLESFRSALNALNATQGLVFSIQSEAPHDSVAGPAEAGSSFEQHAGQPYITEAFRGQIVSNFEQPSGHYDMLEWFRVQPVYYIEVSQRQAERSHRGWLRWYAWSSNELIGQNEHILLAFTQDVVDVHNANFIAARDAYIRDITISAVSIILTIALFVILLCGAGRRYGQPKDVYFSLIDKLYLDIGLAVMVGWSALVLFVAAQLVSEMLRDTFAVVSRAAFITVVIAAIVLGAPLLFWLLSLARRVKAGRFWKHTLIYALPSFMFRKISSEAQALWAGRKLTAKVVLIVVGVFIVLIIVGAIAAEARSGAAVFIVALIVTAFITVLILKYAHRVHRLEQGALAFRDGDYENPIVVGGGELGSIADSISNIGAGINTAVEQRMKSERLKTELITNVSHDIRTPLTSIITYTDLLKHEGLDCEKAPEYLDILMQKSQRLKTLTDELFEAAKAATGNIEVNIAELDIVSLINQVMGEMDSAIKSSRLDIRFNHPDCLNVKADGRLMWRVMENLLSNVFKYALQGSRVYLEVSPPESPYSRIELKNISATELNVDPGELTERFKRGDGSRTDGGSGLGLSIVQSFVHAQNGKFEITIDGDLFKATIWIPVV